MSPNQASGSAREKPQGRCHRLLRMSLLGVCAAAFGGIVWVHSKQGSSPDPTPIAQVLQLQPMAVAPGVYLLGRCLPAAVYMVETSEGLVLIDSGLEADAAPVVGQIAELGFDVRNVKAILLTHVHADHSQGAARLRELSGARIYAGRGDSVLLRAGEPRDGFLSGFDMPDSVIHPTPVDKELVGQETVTIGDASFLAIVAPGHTPGSVCYLLERHGMRTFFAGDVILHLDLSTEGVLGTHIARLSPLYRGNPRDYLESLHHLRNLPVPDFVLPGHPQMGKRPQNPRLGKRRWQLLLDNGIEEMQRVVAHLERHGSSFLDGTPRELLPGLHYLGNMGALAVYVLATPKGLIVVNAPGGAGLMAFLGARFGERGWQRKQVAAVFLTSTEQEAISGLMELTRSTRCVVAGPDAGLAEIRQRCAAGTTVLAEREVKKTDMLDLRAVIPILGLRTPAVAYHLCWAGREVLFSGRVPEVLLSGNIPVKSHATVKEFRRAIKEGDVGMEAYMSSLNSLASVQPAFWLPAVPVHGQSARLYEDEWNKILQVNLQLARFLQAQDRGSR